jgi:hypothetical protein
VRKEVRFSALEVANLQFPIGRADVVCLESASFLDEAALSHGKFCYLISCEVALVRRTSKPVGPSIVGSAHANLHV